MMKHLSAFDSGKFDPNPLLDTLLQKFKLRNDAELSHFLKVSASAISRLRSRQSPLTPGLLIRMHDATDMSIRELRALMGDCRPYFLVSLK